MSSTSMERATRSPAEKRALLAELLRKKVARSRSEFPLSYGQRALLYLSRLQPDGPTYNVMFVSRVNAPIGLDSLRTAFQRVIDRHAVLRTTYTQSDEHLAQQVHTVQEADFAACDARNWTEDQLDARLLGDASRPFNLECGPVARLRLYSRSSESHILLFAVHHIAFDYWSYDIFAHELVTSYAALQAGHEPALHPLEVQFADFVQWQEEEVTGTRREQLLEHWQKVLSGELPTLDLLTDRGRPTVRSYNGSTVDFPLNPALVDRLRIIAKQEKVTLFVLLLAAFEVLLYRYTGQHDILIGTPLACRDAVRFEQLIGYFSTVLPLRANLSGDLPFNLFASQLQDTVLSALENQACPFSLLVKHLAPKRDPSRSPLFDVVFSWEKTRYRCLPQTGTEAIGHASADLPLELLYARQLGAPYDLTLLIFEDHAQLNGTFLYNTDLFNKGRIADLAAHFETLLEGIAAHPEVPLSQIPLCSAVERERLLVAWNRTATVYPREQSVPDLFELQAERTPEAEAVLFANQRVKYGDLNRRANQLAWHLLDRGVRPGARVGVCLDRSVEMVVALLAVLKAGGAYVPLDSAYPRERLKFMLEDSQVKVLLAEKTTPSQLPEDEDKVLWLDSERERIASERDTNPPLATSGESVAYLMYTSGSTGVPKGVEILHRGIVRLVFGQDYAHFGPEEVILQAAPVSFDASTFEIWGALLRGGKCALFPGVIPTVEELREAIQRYNVTTLWLTSSLFNAVLDEAPEVLAPLQQLLIGGEALSVPHVQRMREQLPNVRLINGYGPTETTTFACTFAIPSQLEEGARTIPIGRPIANTRVYVLDERGEPVGVGMTGELYIGGDGVARGYWNRPELTAERFVEDRFHPEAGRRLYRTGDLVRYRADGNLEFLGRADQQVKIRGFRIEPGEIEAVLQKHPEVHRAAVLVREDTPGEKRLVAYVVPRGRGVETAELRCWAKEQLPDYMLPSAFLSMERIPLNANGKVDKQALPLPEQTRADLNEPFVAPQSDLEQSIAGIWKVALGLKEVGRYDNFFDLGGHSLMVVHLHPQLEKLAGRKIPVVDVFRHPTISALAKHLGQTEPKDPSFADVHERAHQQRTAMAQRAEVMRSRRLTDE